MKIFNSRKPEKEYDIAFHWNVTNTCNFNCPQCAGNAVKLEGAYAPETMDIPALKRFLKKLDRTAEFIFTGGEPLLVKNIIDAFTVITKKHYLALITNLSSPRVKELAKKVKSERVAFIKASAHLLELERLQLFDQFFTNYHLLKENGFTVHIAEVAYPFILDKVEFYKKKFEEQGINLEFQAFRGTWRQKSYPEAYSEDERRIFNLDKEIQVYRTDIYHHQGEWCNAGFNVAIIDPQGKIFPCFMIFEKLGSIHEGMNFHDALMKCPLDYCDCPVKVMDPDLFDKAFQKTNSR